MEPQQRPSWGNRRKKKMKKLITLFAIAGMVLALAPTAQAAFPPSDPYRIWFVTDAATVATSTDIAYYNGLADAAGDTVLAGYEWKAVGGTAAISARDNTGALAVGDTGYSAAIDVPIYTTSGELVSNNNAGLWSGTLLTTLHMQSGGNPAFNQSIHVGFLAGGDIRAAGAGSGPLGNTGGFTVAGAIATRTAGNMYNNHTSTPDTELSLYALSEVINAVPEPATMSLLAIGGIALIRRRRRA